MRACLMTCLTGLVALAACEPRVDSPGADGSESGESTEMWMLGTWSNRAPDNAARDITHLQIDPDGTLTTTSVGECGAQPTTTTEYRWSAAGPDAIEVTDLDGSPMDSWEAGPVHLVLRDVCDQTGSAEFLARVLFEGEEEAGRNDYSYVRGRVCLEAQQPPDDPEVIEWDDCVTAWCEGEPPPSLQCVQ